MRALLSFVALTSTLACDLRAPHKTEDPKLVTSIAELTQSLTARPDDVEARHRLAALHLEAEHWFAAAELFKQLSELDPQDGRALAGLADAYLKLAYTERAFDALSRGVSAGKHPEECMIRLAERLRLDGSPEALAQARAFYARFLEAAPQHARAEEARRALRQVEVQLSTTPGGKTATVTPGAVPAIPEHATREGDEQVGALNPFGQAIGRAIAAVQANDPVTAEAALKEALQHQPDDIGALSFLAETYLAQEKVEDARKTAGRAYELNPKDSQARWAFGLVHIRTRGDLGRAIEAWRALARDDPDFARDAGVTRTLEDIDRAQPPPGAQPAPK